MSLIRSTVISKICLKHYPLLYTGIRNAAHWNKDYKPGPCPKTPEEIAAAAKKYNVPLAEYQTFPDDGSGLGDYPKLPLESGDSKDPYYPWDFPELKRNFNEPLDAEADAIGEDRYDVNAKPRFPIGVQLAQFFAFMFGTYAIYHVCENFKWFLAVAEKQYPNSGEVHYTFQPKQ